MNPHLLDKFREITEEEQQIINGSEEIQKELYMEERTDIIDSRRLIDSGKLIEVRTHTRFIHFPKHKHNYIELIYMCSGSTHHVINGIDIILYEGEILFLNQNAEQEIYPAGRDDIAVNFIILPEFFDYALKMMGEEENLIRDFLIDCLKSNNAEISYLYFKVSDILPIQNLLENLIWTIKYKAANKRSINQQTMGLLMLQLMNYTDKMDAGKNNPEQELILTIYRFIEEHYKEGRLSELAEVLNYDVYWLSRIIKKLTGKTYIELLQTKRLNQAAYLLTNTKLTIAEISYAAGYDNFSYFHRIFKKHYKVTPKKYRSNQK